jgi:hypothetical protein
MAWLRLNIRVSVICTPKLQYLTGGKAESSDRLTLNAFPAAALVDL